VGLVSCSKIFQYFEGVCKKSVLDSLLCGRADFQSFCACSQAPEGQSWAAACRSVDFYYSLIASTPRWTALPQWWIERVARRGTPSSQRMFILHFVGEDNPNVLGACVSHLGRMGGYSCVGVGTGE